MKVGILGLGRGWGLARVFSLFPDIKITVGCDKDEKSLNEAGKELKIENLTSDWNKVIESDVDVVVVATPPATHAEYSIAALAADKSVLSEVPAVVTIAETEKLVRAVRKSKGKYMLGANPNYWAFVDGWVEMVREGKIGKPIYAEAEYIHNVRSLMKDSNGKPTWRASFPPIQYCTHSLGPLLKVMGGRCSTATGFSTGSNVWPELGAIDMELGIFRCNSGVLIKILVGFSIAREPGHHCYSIYGTKGCLEKSRYNQNNCDIFGYFEGDSEPRKLEMGLDFPNAPPGANVGGHGTCEFFMVSEFLNAVRENREPAVDVFRALDYTLPGICAHLSAGKGSVAVEIPDFR